MNILDDCIKNPHLYNGCTLCFGRGLIGGDTNCHQTCPRCKGRGIIDFRCPECNGKGVDIGGRNKYCDWCGGSGRDREVR